MKTNRIVLLLAFMSVVFLTSVVAQEMTKDQWQADMASFTQKRADLETQKKKLTDDIANFQTQSEKLDADLKACEDALYALLGVSKADLDAFDRELTDMEKRVAELQRMSDAELINHKDELEKMNNRLGEMAKSKIALIPRYGNRVKDLQDKVTALMSGLQKEKTYTVGTWSRDRDCLWNISKKKDIYNNAWMWPKIWQGNRDKIKDPDVIKPKWVLRIPEGKELSKEEKSAANSYYRKKTKAAEPTTK
jgi:nucleoid-associated protein YgaU